jgi:hypothetical protein
VCISPFAALWPSKETRPKKKKKLFPQKKKKQLVSFVTGTRDLPFSIALTFTALNG